MNPTKVRSVAKGRKGGTTREAHTLDAELAFEQELLVGMTIDLLNAVMADADLSQRELADRLGVTQGRVSQILSGNPNISLKKLAEIGWALGLRFTLVPAALNDRSNTPAAADPAPPSWLTRRSGEA